MVMDFPMMRWMKKDWNRSRTLAVALLCLAVSLPLVSLGIPWLSAHQDLSQRRAASMESLQRYRSVAARLPALQAQLAALQRDHDRAGYWPVGSNLADTVKAMVEQHGITLTSAQEKPGINLGGIPQQAVRLSMMARADQLTALLYALETHEPALFVEDISITNRHAFSSSSTNTTGTLQVMLEVSGYQAKAP